MSETITATAPRITPRRLFFAWLALLAGTTCAVVSYGSATGAVTYAAPGALLEWTLPRGLWLYGLILAALAPIGLVRGLRAGTP